ncbi:hypothetical protein PRUPE_4G035800 [Prunus persica]|uniref:Suppressor of forked domain-containing protein n=1 Tax=Prunus persica TaxID=3760 RepID=A0A251PF52_PRUPE|nr:hypothetical protein PRUPE_4G035800 [Prunus persica]ONI10232.1 hypothetical protein PRUPE_4G035800 [Prunus persica]
MSISQELYPSQDDLLYEEELLRNPFSLKLWWRYLIARSESPFKKRFIIYERALKALPGSYKLWNAYLRERLELVRNLPITHFQYETLNNTFERALVTMHKMPKIWTMYLQTLTEQKLVTRTRRTFDRALCALPVTQHDRIWDPYLKFVSQTGIPIETSLRVYRRYLKYDPAHIEDFIEFLINSSLWQEAAERLASVLNDDQFYSIKGKTKHRLWLELCDLLTKHATEVSGLNVDAIIRGGIRKFTDEVGRLWTSLADYYIRRNLHEKARDIFEEGMTTVVTVRDFSVIFDSYAGFEDSMLVHKMETVDLSDEEEEEEKGLEEDGNEEEEDLRLDVNLSLAEFEKKMLNGFWLHDDKDVDLRLARLEHLMDRRPILANSVLLRQNPHNVEQWHRRVKLFEGNPTKQILTYTEAVRTVDPMKAVGKPHTLWVAFAKLYENHKDIANARVIFDKAVQVNYKTVDNLASLWCEWAEMELRHKNFKGALELMRRATAEPSVEVKRRGIIVNWFSVCFSYVLVCYFRVCYYILLECAPADAKKPLYLQFAKLEEDYGLAKRAMKVYDEATKAVPNHEKLSMYEIYIARAAEIFGIPKTREIYEQAIESGLPDKDVKTMCLKYAELEKSLGEIDRARGVYIFASQFSDPRSDVDFWNKWHEFEVQHGNEDTFREMLRIKRSVSASYSQTHFILPEYMMQKDQRLNMDEAKDKLKQAGVPEDEMAALERQLAPVANGTTTKDGNRKVGFVSAGVESQTDGGIKVAANHEDIELPDASDSEDDEGVEIAQKEVPSAVFGELANKRKEAEKDEGGDGAAATRDGDSHLGALERIKRLKRGG